MKVKINFFFTLTVRLLCCLLKQKYRWGVFCGVLKNSVFKNGVLKNSLVILILSGGSGLISSCSMTSWQNQSIAAQHREVAQVQVAPGSDRFELHRRQSFTFPAEAHLAFVFDPVLEAVHRASTFEQDNHQIEFRLHTVTERAFKRFFLNVTAMQPQSYLDAEYEAKQRDVDYLAFMRLVSWQDRQLVQEAYCQSNQQGEDEDELHQQQALAEELERQKQLTFVEPSSPRGLTLPMNFKRCTLSFDQPRDQVLIHFWWIHLASGKVIDGGRLLGKSGWLTFRKDDPEQLLQAPMEQLAASYAVGGSL